MATPAHALQLGSLRARCALQRPAQRHSASVGPPAGREAEHGTSRPGPHRVIGMRQPQRTRVRASAQEGMQRVPQDAGNKARLPVPPRPADAAIMGGLRLGCFRPAAALRQPGAVCGAGCARLTAHRQGTGSPPGGQYPGFELRLKHLCPPGIPAALRNAAPYPLICSNGPASRPPARPQPPRTPPSAIHFPASARPPPRHLPGCFCAEAPCHRPGIVAAPSLRRSLTAAHPNSARGLFLCRKP